MAIDQSDNFKFYIRKKSLAKMQTHTSQRVSVVIGPNEESDIEVEGGSGPVSNDGRPGTEVVSDHRSRDDKAVSSPLKRIGSTAVRKTAILQIEQLSVSNRIDQQMASVGNEDNDHRLEPGAIQYQQTHGRAQSRQLPS